MNFGLIQFNTVPEMKGSPQILYCSCLASNPGFGHKTMSRMERLGSRIVAATMHEHITES